MDSILSISHLLKDKTLLVEKLQHEWQHTNKELSNQWMDLSKANFINSMMLQESEKLAMTQCSDLTAWNVMLIKTKKCIQQTKPGLQISGTWDHHGISHGHYDAICSLFSELHLNPQIAARVLYQLLDILEVSDINDICYLYVRTIFRGLITSSDKIAFCKLIYHFVNFAFRSIEMGRNSVYQKVVKQTLQMLLTLLKDHSIMVQHFLKSLLSPVIQTTQDLCITALLNGELLDMETLKTAIKSVFLTSLEIATCQMPACLKWLFTSLRRLDSIEYFNTKDLCVYFIECFIFDQIAVKPCRTALIQGKQPLLPQTLEALNRVTQFLQVILTSNIPKNPEMYFQNRRATSSPISKDDTIVMSFLSQLFSWGIHDEDSRGQPRTALSFERFLGCQDNGAFFLLFRSHLDSFLHRLNFVSLSEEDFTDSGPLHPQTRSACLRIQHLHKQLVSYQPLPPTADQEHLIVLSQRPSFQLVEVSRPVNQSSFEVVPRRLQTSSNNPSSGPTHAIAASSKTGGGDGDHLSAHPSSGHRGKNLRFHPELDHHATRNAASSSKYGDQESVATTTSVGDPSEIASAPSVDSEDHGNDSFSELGSPPHLSGRASPEISGGRETPSSQGFFGGANNGGPGSNGPSQAPSNNPTQVAKSSIPERFGKFDIKTAVEGGNFVSGASRQHDISDKVSDSWSTDAHHAADSEMLTTRASASGVTNNNNRIRLDELPTFNLPPNDGRSTAATSQSTGPRSGATASGGPSGASSSLIAGGRASPAWSTTAMTDDDIDLSNLHDFDDDVSSRSRRGVEPSSNVDEENPCCDLAEEDELDDDDEISAEDVELLAALVESEASALRENQPAPDNASSTCSVVSDRHFESITRSSVPGPPADDSVPPLPFRTTVTPSHPHHQHHPTSAVHSATSSMVALHDTASDDTASEISAGDPYSSVPKKLKAPPPSKFDKKYASPTGNNNPNQPITSHHHHRSHHKRHAGVSHRKHNHQSASASTLPLGVTGGGDSSLRLASVMESPSSRTNCASLSKTVMVVTEQQHPDATATLKRQTSGDISEKSENNGPTDANNSTVVGESVPPSTLRLASPCGERVTGGSVVAGVSLDSSVSLHSPAEFSKLIHLKLKRLLADIVSDPAATFTIRCPPLGSLDDTSGSTHREIVEWLRCIQQSGCVTNRQLAEELLSLVRTWETEGASTPGTPLDSDHLLTAATTAIEELRREAITSLSELHDIRMVQLRLQSHLRNLFDSVSFSVDTICRWLIDANVALTFESNSQLTGVLAQDHHGDIDELFQSAVSIFERTVRPADFSRRLFAGCLDPTILSVLSRFIFEQRLFGRSYTSFLLPHDNSRENDEIVSRTLLDHARSDPLDHVPSSVRSGRPWSVARSALNRLVLSPHPVDKLGCLSRCWLAIGQSVLTSIGHQGGSDEFFPIFVYIVAHSNPEHLNSTIKLLKWYGDLSTPVTQSSSSLDPCFLEALFGEWSLTARSPRTFASIDWYSATNLEGAYANILTIHSQTGNDPQQPSTSL